MTTLTVTSKGQITLKKAVLEHLGTEPGGQVNVRLLADGRVEMKAMPAAGGIESFIGVLAGKTAKRASLRQIAETAAAGWAGTAATRARGAKR